VTTLTSTPRSETISREAGTAVFSVSWMRARRTGSGRVMPPSWGGVSGVGHAVDVLEPVSELDHSRVEEGADVLIKSAAGVAVPADGDVRDGVVDTVDCVDGVGDEGELGAVGAEGDRGEVASGAAGAVGGYAVIDGVEGGSGRGRGSRRGRTSRGVCWRRRCRRRRIGGGRRCGGCGAPRRRRFWSRGGRRRR
jgi:hypothetical protein